MENKNYDLKLAGYIWSILKTQPVIVMSWGVDMDTIKPVKGGPVSYTHLTLPTILRV